MADLSTSKGSLYPSNVAGIGRRIGEALLASTPEGVSYLNNAKQNEIRMQQMQAEQQRAEEQGRLDAAGKQIEIFGPLLGNQQFLDSTAPDEVDRIRKQYAQALQIIGRVDPNAARIASENWPVEQKLINRETIDRYGNKVTERVVDKPGMITEQVSGEQLLTPAELAQKQKIAAAGTEIGAGSLVGKSDTSKAIIETAEDRSQVENFSRGIDQLIGFTKSENFVGGLTGDGIRVLNSAYQQFRQVTGQKDELIKNGRLNIDTLDENLNSENVSFLRKAAISGDLRASATLKLAYLLAKRIDPNGKISDADVQLARDIVAGSADQASAVLQLQNLKNATISDFNTTARNRAKALNLTEDERFSPIGVPKARKAVEDYTDEELFDF